MTGRLPYRQEFARCRLQLSTAMQVSDIMSNMVEAGWLQQYDYDKLMTLTEAAQACRSLLWW